MDTLEYIKEKYDLPLDQGMPVKIPVGRVEFCRLFGELRYESGVELGVEQGLFSKELCVNNPELMLYAIDAWTAYDGYREHVSQEKLDRFYETTQKRLELFNCKVMKMFSMDAVKKFDDEELDFVYIDCNHEFQNVTNDIAEWSKKVRKGGIVAGHDFKRYGGKYGLNSCHVKDVVPAWAYAHQIKPWFVLTGDSCPSWFWVV